ncbi:hypothetical protein LTR67_001822 [Exophiala xenobiotica]
MTIGSAGYPFYVAGLFYYDRTGGQAFPIVGGVILGACAPMLWTVVMAIQWSYATEVEKGTYITVQYVLNLLGSTIGALVAFIIILKGTSTANGSPTAVYITFIVLMFLGVATAFFGLVAPKSVRRADNTPIAVFHMLPYKEELRGVVSALQDWRVLAMLPVAFSTEFPISIMPILNAHYFSLRTRALNSVIFYAIALPTAPLVTYLLDKLPYERTKRGLITLSVATVVIVGGWVALIAWVTVSKTFATPPELGVDWTDSNFAGPFVLYIFFGVVFTFHQLLGMWVMGALTNDPRKLGIYGGIWRGMAGAGLAVSFGLSAGGVSYKGQVITFMTLQFLSLLIMFVIIGKYTNITNYGKEADVVVPHYAEEKYHVHTVILDKSDTAEGINVDTTTEGYTLKEGVTA